MKQVTQLFWKVSLNNIPMFTVSENVIVFNCINRVNFIWYLAFQNSKSEPVITCSKLKIKTLKTV